MFPSSSRVKINREVLKDVIGLKLVPRRKRIPTSFQPVTACSPKQERTEMVPEPVTVKDNVPSSKEPVLSLSADPEKVVGYTPEEPQESCPGAQKTKRRKRDDIKLKQKGSRSKDIDTRLRPTGVAGSEGSLRKAARSSGSGLCGDSEYISPQRKTLGKRGQKGSSKGQQRPMFKVKLKNQNRVTKKTKKIDRYPKVTLCDVSQIDDAFHDSSFMLPDYLKNNVVHCFKQEMTARFLVGSGYSGQNKHKSDKGASKNAEFCLSKSQCVTKQQRQLKECADAQKLAVHASFRSKSWTGESSSNCSGAKKGECRTGMWDRDGGEDTGPGSRLIGADKRLKLSDCVKKDILPATPYLECINCKSPVINREGGKRSLWVSDDSWGGFRLAIQENSIHNPYSKMDSPTNADAASSRLLCQKNQMETDELESFTCQRVRVYFGKNYFSCARTYKPWPFSNIDVTATRPGVTACPEESVDPPDNSDRHIKQQTAVSSSLENYMFPNSRGQVFPLNEKQERDAEYIFAEDNERSNENVSPDDTQDFLSQLMAAEELPERPFFTSPGPYGKESGRVPFSSCTMTNKSSTSAQLSSNVGVSDSKMVTPSSMSSPFTPDDLSSFSTTPSSLSLSSFLLMTPKSIESAGSSPPLVRAVENTPYSKDFQSTSCTSSSSAPQHDFDCFQRFESSLHFSEDKQESNEKVCANDCLQDVVLPIARPVNVLKDKMFHNAFAEFYHTLPPMLSPYTSPQRRSRTSFPLKSLSCSEREVESKSKCTSGHDGSPGSYMPKGVDTEENCEEVSRNFKTPRNLKELQSHSSDDVDEEESQDVTDSEDDVEQVYKNDQASSGPETEDTSDVLTEPCTSLSTEEEALVEKGPSCSARADASCPSELKESEKEKIKAGAAGDARLDELTAYEQDILLVDMIQDDRELFENVSQEGLLKLGPARLYKPKPIGMVKTLSPGTNRPSLTNKERLTSIKLNFLSSLSDDAEDSEERPWRPQCRRTEAQSSTWPSSPARKWPSKTVTSLSSRICPPAAVKNVPSITNPVKVADLRHQNSNVYCRLYFSESLSCGFKVCRFRHVPLEGDEKFCVETVMRFTKNSMCLQKAGTVFTRYYTNNPPGLYFSIPVFFSLIWSLLKANMITDVFAVLRVSLAHKIVPGREFLLAFFKYVRERGLVGLVPELMQLTFKMASAGLVLSSDCLDWVKKTPEVQQSIWPNLTSSKLSTVAPVPQSLTLAHAVVEMELCSKQEEWRRMGEVFRSVCRSSQDTNLVEQISGRIAISLLSECKDKLSLPFAAFAETVCQDGEDGMVKGFLGRIGVSLMLRYHKTHHWAKGRRVVEVLCLSKINYSTLKGLFGNEDQASRCFLITVATELFLSSGSLEGALNTLKENEWFLSSRAWPCDAADLESRARVLTRLAAKTSLRDTLEVLCNLPGLQEPTRDLIDISKFHPLFNAHFKVCVDRQALPVAADTVDLMLSKKLAVDQGILKILFHKLAKQNLWLRAREIFRHCLSMGYFDGVSAPPGFTALIVPCELGEVELALTIEMFITVNATAIFSATTPCSLSITLKRTLNCEQEYLAAGSRLLSAACIPQPKLLIQFKAVNSWQEQVFTLDVPSAQCWLRRNLLWANEVWLH